MVAAAQRAAVPVATPRPAPALAEVDVDQAILWDVAAPSDAGFYGWVAGEAADAANHHPDVTITYPEVSVSITTHDAGGLTDLDVDMARAISSIARDLDVAVLPDGGAR